MILIIQCCREKLHYFEFVKPIEDVLKKDKIMFELVHYRCVNKKVVSKADKVIISGTSLKDNFFLQDLECFTWLKKFDKPVLGICAGMHILGLLFNGSLKEKTEIGLNNVFFEKEFLGLKNTVECYELHNFYVESSEFEGFARSKDCLQAVKHRYKPFYGVLFHPEVRNKELLEVFASL